jgi:hypothetical protein
MESGPWEPAGPDWQKARRTDVVTGIAAAEIQSPDPRRLAARWSEILQVAATENDAGQPVIELDNAILRFVDATDGRGEGLAALDLTAAEGASPDVDQIGGVRLRLV